MAAYDKSCKLCNSDLHKNKNIKKETPGINVKI